MAYEKKPRITGKEFRITRLDERCIMLERWVYKVNPKTKESVGRWEPYGYYGQFKHLAEALLRFNILVPEGTLENQVKDLITELKATEERLSKQISEKL